MNSLGIDWDKRRTVRVLCGAHNGKTGRFVNFIGLASVIICLESGEDIILPLSDVTFSVEPFCFETMSVQETLLHHYENSDKVIVPRKDLHEIEERLSSMKDQIDSMQKKLNQSLKTLHETMTDRMEMCQQKKWKP